jgi:hypothetical protein
MDPALTVLAGVALGGGISTLNARYMLVHQERRNAASRLTDAIVDAQMLTRRPLKEENVSRAADDVYRATRRYSALVPASVAERVEPLHIVLFMAGGHVDDADPNFDLAYILKRAFDDALGTLDAYVLGRGLFIWRSLPIRSFPNGAEIMESATDDGMPGEPLARVRQLLNEFPDPPDRQTKFFRM